MSYNGGPCWSCIEKSCKNCPCAVCKEYDNILGYIEDTPMMVQAGKDSSDCDHFIERLYKEVKDFFTVTNDENERILAVKWRGFPAGLKEKEIDQWMDSEHSKGYGYIYENISV